MSTAPGLSRSVSASEGGWTLSVTSAFARTSGSRRAPWSVYDASAKPAASPAPGSITTSTPAFAIRGTRSGTSATRFSPETVSLGTPTIIDLDLLWCGTRIIEPHGVSPPRVLVLTACALALPFFPWDFRTYHAGLRGDDPDRHPRPQPDRRTGRADVARARRVLRAGRVYPRGADAALECVCVRGDLRGGTGTAGHRVRPPDVSRRGSPASTSPS